MRVVGITRTGSDHVEVAALTDADDAVRVLAPLDEFWRDPGSYLTRDTGGTTFPRGEVTLVPPVLPGAKVICIGLNYLRHLAEGSYRAEPLPEYPTLFARWPSTLTVDGAEIPVPVDEEGLDWEGEVMAWVGRELYCATADEAVDAVVGYSTFNDVTARRAQKTTSQWILGKNADCSGPLGPLVPADYVGDLRDGLHIRTRVNGVTVQDASTDDMVYAVGETLAYISRTITLRPGDLLATGTPSGVGYARNPAWLLHPGDRVEVEVEKLGVLRNTIVAAQRRPAHC
ncbi:fumarylacetoacetate hydrolase family protein [Mycolicibacterium goodii]|uniref:Fumarylacetoacetate hydrolase n=1 Tax=Mycolicibacterium goodii TaxID=134601 RepID=A0A0K0X2D1_MYCGD|nr:fumarylacetoacetate hydrolase [Mycolicibacterium goodii]